MKTPAAEPVCPNFRIETTSAMNALCNRHRESCDDQRLKAGNGKPFRTARSFLCRKRQIPHQRALQRIAAPSHG